MRDEQRRVRLARALGVAALLLAGLGFWWGHARERGPRDAPPAPSKTRPAVESAEIQPAPAAPENQRELVPAEEGARASSGSPRVRVVVVAQGTQNPIAGARVRAGPSDPVELAALELVTDERGACEFGLAPVVKRIALHVEQKGFVHSMTWHVLSEGLELHVGLLQGATLFGRVRAADDSAPIPGARLLLWRECGCPRSVAVADDEGGYELAGVPLHAKARIDFEAEDFARASRTFELRSDEPRIEQDFRLERGVAVEGRVEDYTDASAVAGASVSGFLTDAIGHFRTRVMPMTFGSFTLNTAKPGYCPLTAFMRMDELGRAPLVIRLPRSVAVEGIVRDPEGRPVPGAHVSANFDGRQVYERTAPDDWPANRTLAMEPNGRETKADANGRFRVTGLLPWDARTSISAGAKGFARVDVPLARVAGPGETMERELRLLPLEQPTSATVHGAITLDGARGELAGTIHWTGATLEGTEDFDDGSYAVEVEPGDVHLQVEVEGLAVPVEDDALDVHVEAGHWLEHDFELRAPTAAISGRVRFEDGSPAPDVPVEVSYQARWSRVDSRWRLTSTTKTDAGGRFRVEVADLKQRCRVEASLDHQQATAEGVAPGTNDVELELARPAKIWFRLIDARTHAALPLSGFACYWKRAGTQKLHGWGRSVEADLDGWYEDRLPSGALDVEVRPGSGEYRRLSQRLELTPTGGPRRVEFLLEPGIALELRLEAGQEPLPKNCLALLVESEDQAELESESRSEIADRALASRSVTFARGDRETLYGLAPGVLRFRVAPEDVLIEPETVTVVEGPNPPVFVRWRRR